MVVDADYVGRQFPSSRPYEVGAEKLREFALAVGATHPIHHDHAAAVARGHKGIVAAPTFAAVVAQRAESAYISDPDAGIDFSRVVHASERFTYHRPIIAGDLLDAVVHVDAVTVRGGLSMVSTRTEISDHDNGAPVSTVYSTLAVRGSDD